jgi:WD40 repeat protein
MDVDRAIAVIELVLAPKALTPVQSQIIRGAIAGKSYQEIITTIESDGETRSERYQISYIKEAGANLWQSLSRALGQKVTKVNLLAVLRWYAKQPELNIPDQLASPQPHSVKIDWGDRLQRPSLGRLADDPATILATLRQAPTFQSLTLDPTTHGLGETAVETPFYGRTEELTTLTNWCLVERCRTISLLGMGGMGKTTLTGELVRRLKSNFDFVIWRSLVNAPGVRDILREWLQFLSPEPLLDLPESIEGRSELLIAYLTRNRCLLVLDNVESILQDRVQAGRYLPGYESYGQLFRSIGELPHQSCLLLTSREQPQEIARSAAIWPKLVRSFAVGGLAPDVAHQLVQACGCPQLPELMWQEVYAHYSGNPLALKMATIAAVEMTGGGAAMLGLYPLMKAGQLQFQTIEDILQRQFNRLSLIEQQLVYWLAIEREPITGAELRANLVPNPSLEPEIFNALQSLLRRCVAVRQAQTWSLEPVMMVYVTGRAIDEIVAELSPQPTESHTDLPTQFWHLNTYAIIKATTKDYLRRAQTQLILRPILDRCVAIWETPAAFIQHLRRILARWQSLGVVPRGYLAGNILNLSIELTSDRWGSLSSGESLKDLDCSQLPIWSAYLADANLHHVNFTAAAFDRTVFTQTFNGIVSVAFNPVGDLVATGDSNGDIYLWRMSDGQRVALYQGHANWIRSLAFTPDGKILASSSDDLTIGFWDLQTGRKLLTLGPPTYSFRRVSFSQDGQQLITGGDDSRVLIYDFPQLLIDAQNPAIEVAYTQELLGHTNWVFSVNHSPDGSQLASASADGTVRIWDLATGAVVHVLSHPHWAIRTIFSPDGRRLVVSGLSATIYVWDLSSGELIQTLTGHTDWVWSIASPIDGSTLVSAGEDRTIRVWDLTTGICTNVFRAHQQRIWALAIAPDGTLVSGSEDQSIKIWDFQRGKCLKTINGYGNWIKSIAVVPDTNWLISGHRDCQIRIWDLSNRACIHTFTGHTAAIIAIAVSPDGRYLASGSLDRTIRLWDLRDLVCVNTIEAMVDGSWSLGFSPDSHQLIASCEHAQLQIWDIATGRLDRTLTTDTRRIQSIALCPIHNFIATAWEHTIKIWDFATGECLHAFNTQQRSHSIAFSPDGRYIASGSMDTTVKVWETTNWECIQTLSGHQGWIMSLAFSPDRPHELITGSCDRTIKRWDLATGECIRTYYGHTNWVWSIAYSHDGRSIISASEDGTMKIWDLDRSQPLHTLQLKLPYEDLQISDATGLLLGQRQTLKLLGAVEE